jgi:hypothetical protein
MTTLIPLNIVIGDRNYRIRIAPEDEEYMRKTLKVINEKIIAFKTEFAGKDMQDYIAMVMIWYATQAAAGRAPESEKAIAEGLQKIEVLLEQFGEQGSMP